MRFIANHHRRKSPLEWLAKDMGYKTPCWVWQRAHSSNGYARACVGNAQARDAHLVYYEKYKGPIPEGLELDHLCRVTLCVNPEHLEAVTPAVNARRRPSTKLNAQAVQQIRERRAQGELYKTLASDFGVSDTTIGDVVSGKRW
jgi:hypothetical protein